MHRVVRFEGEQHCHWDLSEDAETVFALLTRVTWAQVLVKALVEVLSNRIDVLLFPTHSLYPAPMPDPCAHVFIVARDRA